MSICLKLSATLGISAFISFAAIADQSIHFIGQVSGFEKSPEFVGGTVDILGFKKLNDFTDDNIVACAIASPVSSDRKIDLTLSNCGGTSWDQLSAVILGFNVVGDSFSRNATIDLAKALETGVAQADVNQVTHALSTSMSSNCDGQEGHTIVDAFNYLAQVFPYSTNGKVYSFDDAVFLNDADSQVILASGLQKKFDSVCK